MCFSFPLGIHHYLSIQTLTTLDLQRNNIGAEGAQHLAQALQNNTVRDVFFVSTTYSTLSFNTDTHHAQSLLQQYRCRRSTTSGWSIKKQHGERCVLRVHYVFTIIFQYRHSPRSILAATISVQEENNIWLKHYKKTRWEMCSSFPLGIHQYLLDIDTHHAQSSIRRNRCTRSAPSDEWTDCFAEKGFLLVITNAFCVPPNGYVHINICTHCLYYAWNSSIFVREEFYT
jgi:hypothetical protein